MANTAGIQDALSHLTVGELAELRMEAQAILGERLAERRSALHEQFSAVCAREGVTLREVFLSGLGGRDQTH